VIPVINKIDLPSAQPEMVRDQIEDIVGSTEHAILASAKEGIGVRDILEAIVQRCRRPGATPTRRSRRWFRLWYDPYVGGRAHSRDRRDDRGGMRIRLVALGQDYDVEQLGTFQPKRRSRRAGVARSVPDPGIKRWPMRRSATP